MPVHGFSKTILISALFLVLALPGVYLTNSRAVQLQQPESIAPATASETQSAAIIIAGDRSDHEFQTQIMYGADQVYNVLVNDRGFMASRVYYLGSLMGGSHPNVNAISSYANIQYALTTWASANVDSSHGLLIYLFDHGGSGGMAIPGGTLYAASVNGWLNILEGSKSLTRVIIVYEACESGSFIPTLSKANRIVVSSTDATNSAWPSVDWAYFSESFWGSIANGNTIGDAFVAGWYNVEKNGHYTNQFPLIDDNHDMIGHGPQVVMVWGLPVAFLPNGGDGTDALDTKITGYSGSLFSPLVYLRAPRYLVGKYSDNHIPVTVQVENNTPITSVRVWTSPPGWVSNPPLPPDNETSGQHMGSETGKLVDYLVPAQPFNGTYTGVIDNPAGGPIPRGDYNISIYAMTASGISDTAFVQGNVNDNGLPPTDTRPPVVAITHPLDGALVAGNVNIKATANDDQGLDRVELYIDGSLIDNTTMPSTTPYPDVMHALVTTAYIDGIHVILAKAFDTSGLYSTATATINVENNYVPPIPGFLPALVIGFAIAGIAWIIGRRTLLAKERNE